MNAQCTGLLSLSFAFFESSDEHRDKFKVRRNKSWEQQQLDRVTAAAAAAAAPEASCDTAAAAATTIYLSTPCRLPL